MAKVTFMDGIATISGRIGDVVFRTSSLGKTYACKAPECVYRKPTRKEMKQRNRFALVCRVVSVLLADPALRKAYEKEFKKNHAGIRTLRQYVFKQVWYGLPK